VPGTTGITGVVFDRSVVGEPDVVDAVIVQPGVVFSFYM
jgi:hypothetical protein